MAFNPSQSTFSPLRGTKGQNPHINFPSLIIIRIGGGSYQSHHSNVFHSEQGAQLMPIMNEVFGVFFSPPSSFSFKWLPWEGALKTPFLLYLRCFLPGDRSCHYGRSPFLPFSLMDPVLQTRVVQMKILLCEIRLQQCFALNSSPQQFCCCHMDFASTAWV